MQDLKDIRQKIDAVDEQLAMLVKERMALSGEVAQVKKVSGGKVYDPERERQLLNRLSDLVGPENEAEIRMVYGTLLALSKRRQRAILGGSSSLSAEIRASQAMAGEFPKRAMVACPGVEGSYSQQAVCKMFELPTILYFKDSEKTMDAVEAGLCPYGVIPVENAAAGVVTSAFDAMVRRKFYIVKGLRMPVDHVLLGKRGSRLGDIRVISSQPNALSQCGEFLRGLQECESVAASNTAVAAREVAASSRMDIAAISSRECAGLYGLEVLAENIADLPTNYTRFLCISKKLEIYGDVRKISLRLSLADGPQALYALLNRFVALDIDLKNLGVRPSPQGMHRKVLTLEFEASLRDARILPLLDDLATDPQISDFAFLGAYGEE